MDTFLHAERAYTILELNNAIRGVLKREFPAAVWVCGEIQDFKASRDKRHIYFNLVQKHPEADEIMAKASAAIFEGRKALIFERLKRAEAPFELKDDIEIKIKCELDFYPKYGNFNLIVTDIDPIYTLGKMAQTRARIIEDLRARGLLEKNRSLELPAVPLHIGLITAADSAAYHDFTNELKLSGYGYTVSVRDCYMQGDRVEQDVVGALAYFNAQDVRELDAIVISRGGGSTADLAWFDNKRIAESIAASRFPVITALGHQINTTICDLVAHTSCKTPTKAAQLLNDRVRFFLEELQSAQERICETARLKVSNTKTELRSITMKTESLVSRYFRAHRELLIEKRHILERIARMMLLHAREATRAVAGKLVPACERFFKHEHEHLAQAGSKTRMLDPVNVLKRGYSITFKGAQAVKTIDDVETGDVLRTVLFQGAVSSTVIKKERIHEQETDSIQRGDGGIEQDPSRS